MLEVIALIIAVYGACVATIVAIHALRADRVSVFVSHKWSYPLHFAPADSTAEGLTWRPSELLLYAVNNGRRDVVVSSLMLEIPGLCRVAPDFVENAFFEEAADSGIHEENNQRLAPGDTMEVRFDTQALNRLLGQIERQRGIVTPRVRGVLQDTMGKVYCGSWFEVDDDSGTS